MPDLLIPIALERLHTGFLGARHRDVLAGLLAAVAHATAEDEILPTYLNAAYLVAVSVLGAEPGAGGVR